MQHLQKTLRYRELKEQNAGFSAQIHRVSLTKTWFKKRHFNTVTFQLDTESAVLYLLRLGRNITADLVSNCDLGCTLRWKTERGGSGAYLWNLAIYHTVFLTDLFTTTYRFIQMTQFTSLFRCQNITVYLDTTIYWFLYHNLPVYLSLSTGLLKSTIYQFI